jgi:translation initiation factor IF-2
MRNLNAPRSDAGARRTRDRQPPRPSANFRIAAPPPLKARPPEEKKPPQQPTGPKKLAEIPKDLQNRGDVPLKIEDILRQPTKPLAPPVPVVTDEEEEDERNKGKKRPGGVVGRDARHKERNARQAKRKEAAGTEERGGRLTALIEDERPERVKKLTRIRKKAGPQPRKGKVPIDLPITVRSLSEAIGMPKGELLFKLMGQGVANVNINSTLDPDLAEAIALEKGCELDVKRKADVEEQILSDLKKEDRPEDLVPRAPIVTIMGHVDHGKTSLLDKIRQSNVVATEAGGITQVIRAWRVEHGGRPITFLDTPGHEAFTKMRARGANVTDVAVIVVAADDGVMPQTEEAINHAKAAGVSIVVAINKVDLPSANVRRTEQQLYGLGLIPDTMGGDTPFVQTSAASGKGIDQLLDMLSLVAELKELKANPNKPGQGTCLEANLTEGEGVFATLLVQSGTLRRGDVVVCGPAYGRVRALYNDLGHPINEAGPSVPVRITGLDEVPNADDAFLVVPELTVAREIAEKHKVQLQEASVTHRAPISLETLKEVKIAELKVILKADFRGSVEAIRKELEKLQHEEVRVRVLHTGIGAITESDVQLALTSPQDTLILGFNVVPDDRAKSLAEERGVQIKQYNIIYQLTDDVRSALEGKLKPREEIIHLGRAVVRQVFKISRVGAVAGCYVTQGTIERSAKVRVIRNGVVVYPPPDRTVGLESLKRHKDDVREVREGYDCGLKIAGYDDVKVDDVIEAYRVEQIQRTLS